MRSKCLHEKAKPPCIACREAGLGAADWYVLSPHCLPSPSAPIASPRLTPPPITALPSPPHPIPSHPIPSLVVENGHAACPSGCPEGRAPSCDVARRADEPPPFSIFPVRGQPDNDREYRHPRMRADKSQKRDSAKMRRDILDAPVIPSPTPLKNIKGVDEWDYLPPLPDTIEAVNQFTRNYFQLGFIPKQAFPERLRTDSRSISVFLLLSILSISARFTPSLVERHGGGMKAAETFMDRATAVALSELYQVPSLERCQAFYLLSIAQQGSGMKNKSYVWQPAPSPDFAEHGLANY